MINNCKAVIFDFNGTLFFDNDKHVMAWGKMSELLRGYGISDEELHTHFNGVPNAKIVKYLLSNSKDTVKYLMSGSEDTDEFLCHKYSYLKEEYYREFCKNDLKNFHLVEGSEDFFDQLKANNIPFTIASASIKQNIEFFIESFNLDKWIDTDTIVYDNGTYQNKIQMFKDAAGKLGVDIEDCLVIEDSKSGIINAYSAGCNNIIVINSANKMEEYSKLPGVIGVINDFTSLTK